MISKTGTYLAIFLLVACSDANTLEPVATTGPVMPVYDDNTAFVLAGQEIPADEYDYYLFDFTSDEPIEANAQEIRTALQDNPIGSTYLSVIGPNAEHNFAVLQTLMKQNELAPCPAVTFIYLGPADREKAVRQLLGPLDMNLRYVVYP